jgi:hypothetical protein
MAGQPDAERATRKAITEQYEDFKSKLHHAIGAHDGSVDADHRVAVLQRQLWNQRSLLDLEVNDAEGAARASREAVRQGELAVKLSKSTITDRVALLERAVAEGQRKGRGIAEAARERK